MAATGGKLPLGRASERGVASIAGDQERDDIGKQELPNDRPVAREHFRSLVYKIERCPDDQRHD
jgi:hypothetical protein